MGVGYPSTWVFPISKWLASQVFSIEYQIQDEPPNSSKNRFGMVWMCFFRIMVIFGGFYVKLRVAAGESPAPASPAFRQAAIGRCIEFLQAITAQLLALKNQQFLQGGAWEFYGRICPSENFGLTKNPHFYGGSKKILRRFQKNNTITVQWILTLYSNG